MLVLILLLSSVLGGQPELHPDHSSGAGPALSLCYGLGCPGLGLQGRYDLPLAYPGGSPLFLTGSAGGGFSPANLTPGWTANLGLLWGLHHRVGVETGYGAVAVQRLALHGTTVASWSVYGPHAAANYEYMTASGWFFRALVGWALPIDERLEPAGRRAFFDLGLRTGWKFW